MKNILVPMVSLAGVIGLIAGYPELAYFSGIVHGWSCISKPPKDAQSSRITFGVVVLAGLGFAATSPFRWWQGILIGFAFTGFLWMLLSPFQRDGGAEGV